MDFLVVEAVMLKTTLLTGFQPQNFQFKINFVLFTSILQQFKKIYGYVIYGYVCVCAVCGVVYECLCNNDVGADEKT